MSTRQTKIAAGSLIALLLLSGPYLSAAADLKETGGKLWQIVSGKNAKDEKEVRTLLDTWLQAQNTGNFTTYQSCYASRFQGIRRTGNRTIAFDRAGWMNDRGKMFKKPMTVQMDKVELRINPNTIIVRFEQTWASGSYKDTGPKELFLVKEGANWKIAREELLQSNVLAGAEKASEQKAASAGGVYFNFVRESGPGVLHVIMSDPGDENLPSDNLILEGGDAVRQIGIGKGPMDDLLIGDAVGPVKFRFFTEKGEACEATLEQTELVSLETPHFSVRDNLMRGEITKEEYASSSWTNGNKVVAFHVAEEACRNQDIRWAQPASSKGAAAIRETTDEATFRTAVRKFRELGSYTDVQNRYKKETGAQDRWDDRVSQSNVEVWSSGGNPNEKMVSLLVIEGSGCGGFAGHLWALWRVDAAGKWTSINLGANGQEFSLSPWFALDVNGDGRLEWVVEQFPNKYYFLRMEGNSLTIYKDLEIPFHDCPC